MPHKLQDFFGDLPHMRLVKGTVCAVGPVAGKHVEVGARVCFQRLHFAWYKKMEDGTYFGWIDFNQLAGFPEDDEEEDRYACGVDEVSEEESQEEISPELASEYSM